MTRKNRTNYTAQQKVALLKRHLVDGVAVSVICEEKELQPVLFYRWQKEFFERGPSVFERKRGPKPKDPQREVKDLQAELHRKNEVIAELMSAYIDQKKKNGVA